MIKYLFILFLLTSLSQAQTFSVATYNVENLFDMQLNGTEYPEYKPNQHHWTAETLKKKLLNLSEVICGVNADIIALQEVENEQALKLLQKTLKRVGCYYPHYRITRKKKSAIQVAVLSKFPIAVSKEVRVSQSLTYRNILELKMTIHQYPLYLFINHWSSKRSDESKRIASAKTLMKRLQELPSHSEYILLGDFNNDYDEHLYQRKSAITHVLNTINDKGKFFRVHELVYGSFTHYNLWLEQPNFRRWSYNFYGNKQALDAIVLPATLFDGKGVEYVDGSFNVFKKRYLFQKYGYLFRWQYKKNRHLGKGYSDHLPIYATFSTSQNYQATFKETKEGLIDALLQSSPYYPLKLKKVTVLSVKKNKAIIRQEGTDKTMAIYGIEKSLKVGHRYDIVVYYGKKYQGNYEVIDFEIEKRYDAQPQTKE